jgi:hypothetical protein
MFREDLDRYDDIVNPLKPWRSASVIFLVAWAVVLADILDLPFAGRMARTGGFDPLILLFPFLVVALYLAFWTVWRIGRLNQKRKSRALRDRLRVDALPPGD